MNFTMSAAWQPFTTPRGVRSLHSPRSTGDVNSVARLVPRMLLDMQNRGQLAAGMASFRPDRNALINTHKEVGTVAESFRLNHREEFEAIMRRGGRAGRDRPRALCHLRRQRPIATPSRSSATMAARRSGLRSRSTASSPITKSSRKSCSPRATIT